MLKKYFILLAFSTITCDAVSQDVANTFVPKDLKKNNKTLLLKVPYNAATTPYNEDKAPYTDKKSIDKLKEFMVDNYSGQFAIVESSESIDISYPDTTIYKYVLVFSGALKQDDFKNISNKENFFDENDSSFIGIGSSLYIFDRSSNHNLYESGESAITYKLFKINNRGLKAQIEFINFKKLKKYIEILNN